MRPILHTDESDLRRMNPGHFGSDALLRALRQVLQPVTSSGPCTAEDDTSEKCLAPRGQAVGGKFKPAATAFIYVLMHLPFSLYQGHPKVLIHGSLGSLHTEPAGLYGDVVVPSASHLSEHKALKLHNDQIDIAGYVFTLSASL